MPNKLSDQQLKYLGECTQALLVKKEGAKGSKIDVVMTMIKLQDEAKGRMFTETIANIADMSNVSHVTVTEVLRNMEKFDLLIRKRNRGRASNNYMLNLPS